MAIRPWIKSIDEAEKKALKEQQSA